MTDDFVVAILAGGEGRRIGGRKPLRRLGGERLIDRALRQALGWSDAVVVCVREGFQVQPLDAELVEDEPGLAGPLGGLVAGLRYAQGLGRSLLLTMPADTPFLPQDLPGRLGEAMGEAGGALAASGGRLHPTCGLWRVSAIELLPAYVSSGRRSLKGFAETIGAVAVAWPAEPFDPFANINTAVDLAEAERRIAS